jgi:DNA-binding NtrC family response regulator
VVDGYANHRGETYEVLVSQPEPREPVVEAMIKMQGSLTGRASAEEGHRAAEAVAGVECDRDLYLLFLRIWVDVACHCDRREEALAVLRRAESLVSHETCPEVRTSLLLREGVLHGAMGNKAAREECQKRGIAFLPPDSPRRRMFVYSRVLFLAQMGRGAEVEEEIAWLEGQVDEVFRPAYIALLRFTNCVETGHAREAEGHLAVFLADPASRSSVALHRLGLWTTAMELMLGRGEVREVPPPPDGKWDGGTLVPVWANALCQLLAGKPAEGLHWARLAVQRDPEFNIHVGFPYYTLIRAELAAGNGEAARRVQIERHRRGFVNYIDDLFLARADLLAGDVESARRRFATVNRACEVYGAEGRLDFELRMACELKPTDLIDLARHSQRAREPRPVAPAGPPAPPLARRGLARLVGQSPALEAVRRAVKRFAPLDVPVLITGETGTGKELAARALHEESPRGGKPFIAVNCAAITDSLLESELFGHERGAFTGATRARKGIFEEAGRGTVLLDEIGEISPRLQVMLLRLLESDEVRPVGSSRTRKIHCRIVAATNADLEEMTAAGAFRKDLLFRLKRLEITIPSLRERRGDILPLADFFLSEGRTDGGRPVMSAELRDALRGSDWPGNVRELHSAVERMRLLNSDKLEYELADLGSEGSAAAALAREPFPPGSPEPAARPEPTVPSGGGEIAGMLRSGHRDLRRLPRLRQLFREHTVLTRAEVVAVMRVSPTTATRDLKALCAEGLIEKVEPNRSPRSHYFRLKSPG